MRIILLALCFILKTKTSRDFFRGTFLGQYDVLGCVNMFVLISSFGAHGGHFHAYKDIPHFCFVPSIRFTGYVSCFFVSIYHLSRSVFGTLPPKMALFLGFFARHFPVLSFHDPIYRAGYGPLVLICNPLQFLYCVHCKSHV